MSTWRRALVIGFFFIVVGAAYALLQGTPIWRDLEGATFLIALGISMTFAFSLLLRGSREL